MCKKLISVTVLLFHLQLALTIVHIAVAVFCAGWIGKVKTLTKDQFLLHFC